MEMDTLYTGHPTAGAPSPGYGTIHMVLASTWLHRETALTPWVRGSLFVPTLPGSSLSQNSTSLDISLTLVNLHLLKQSQAPPWRVATAS